MKKFKLFFDSSFNKLNIAILNKNNDLVDKLSILTHNNLTEIALEHLSSIMKKNKIKNKQIEAFYVTLGPGSFTGVRIGCIVSKTWCTIYKSCKLYTISSLRIQVPYTEGISVIDARGNKEYYSVIRNGICSLKLAENKDFEQICKANLDLPLYKNFENTNIFESFINNLDNFEIVEDIKIVSPIYIKPPV